MKVAMVATSLSRSGGGVSAAVEALSRNVAAQGTDVRVLGLDEAAWRAGDKNNWKGAPATTFKVIGPRALGYAPDMVRALIEWAPDVVHTHGIWMHPSRSVLQWARRTGRSYIVSPHGMLGPAALAFSPGKKRLSRWLYQDAALDRANALHATCLEEAEEIRAFGLSRPIAVSPNGIDLRAAPFSAREAATSPPFVLSLGRIHPKKALDRLVQAWALVAESFPQWRLKIVGPSEIGYADELERLARDLKLASVDILSPVFGAEKTALLAEAELFALSTLHENFGMTVAESLSVSTPVISTKGAPWSGLEVNKCGWWIDHGVEPLASALRTAMSLSPEERRAMGERGRAWMQRDFAWNRIARQMADVYSWLAEGGDRPTCVRIG